MHNGYTGPFSNNPGGIIVSFIATIVLPVGGSAGENGAVVGVYVYIVDGAKGPMFGVALVGEQGVPVPLLPIRIKYKFVLPELLITFTVVN